VIKSLKKRSTNVVDDLEGLLIAIKEGDEIKTKRRPVSVWKDARLIELRDQVDNLGEIDFEDTTHLDLLCGLLNQTAIVLCTMTMKQVQAGHEIDFKRCYDYCL